MGSCPPLYRQYSSVTRGLMSPQSLHQQCHPPAFPTMPSATSMVGLGQGCSCVPITLLPADPWGLAAHSPFVSPSSPLFLALVLCSLDFCFFFFFFLHPSFPSSPLLSPHPEDSHQPPSAVPSVCHPHPPSLHHSPILSSFSFCLQLALIRYLSCSAMLLVAPTSSQGTGAELDN